MVAAKKSPAPLVYVAPVGVPKLPARFRADVMVSRQDDKPLTAADLEALRALYPRPKAATSKRTARPRAALTARTKPAAKRRASKR